MLVIIFDSLFTGNNHFKSFAIFRLHVICSIHLNFYYISVKKNGLNLIFQFSGLNLYLFLLHLYGCFLNVISFLKTGTSPSSPNIALRNCMRAAGYYRVPDEANRDKFSTSMQKWCSYVFCVLSKSFVEIITF